ncbi:ATP-binding protein [Sphaerotilus sp.]|uniref:ATP-binding protein n=1 Tax=Sphaerotilus sp. TaxID=2093942 RepID=UPI002ACD68DC|nr:ATP-binding protein [Sphaerotilus sp.]MDZ7857347.1 ATP-binding protein [Sphaerotilus sp.]
MVHDSATATAAAATAATAPHQAHRRAPPWALQAACAVLLAWLVGLGVGGPMPGAASAGLWPVAGLSLGLLLRWRQRAWPALASGWLVGHAVWLARLPGGEGGAPVTLALGAVTLAAVVALQTMASGQLLRGLRRQVRQHPGWQPLRFAAVAALASTVGSALLVGAWGLLGLVGTPDGHTTGLLRLWLDMGLAQLVGLLLVTPLMLIAPQPGERMSGRTLLAMLTFPVQCLGLGLTLLAVSLAGSLGVQTRTEAFQGEARALAMALQNHIDMAVSDVERLRDFHYRRQIVQEEFDTVARPMAARSPWVLHFGWLERVADENRSVFEDSPFGQDGQYIREMNAEGALVRARQRPLYYPLRWATPSDGNEALLCVDETGDPERHIAVREAVAFGGVRATAPYVSLARAASDVSAVTLYAPVLTGSMDVDGRHDASRVHGLVSAVIDLGRMVERTQAQLAGGRLDLLLHEATQADSAGVYSHHDLTRHPRPVEPWLPHAAPQVETLFTSDLHAQAEVQFADRRWTLLMRPGWLDHTPWPSRLQVGILATGLAFTALLTGIVLVRQRHDRAMQQVLDGLEDQVAHRTQELAQSNTQLSAEVEERRRLEVDLRHASEQAHQANQAKTMFLANMSHEIRTPLNAVIGYAQILLDEPQHDDSTRSRLRTVLQAGQRLLRLINDVLDLSKIEAGGLQLHRQHFDLRQELDEIVQLMAPRAQARGLAFTATLVLEAAEPVHADRTKVGQIVLNLLSNAIKFTDRGEVTLAAAREGDTVHLTVRDSGPGMAAEELGQLFAPFRQGQAGQDKGGTGLGLVLARHMARSMGGDLVLDSTPGLGTTARLTLPLPRSAEGSAALPRHTGPQRLALDSPLRALVVEDDAHSRDILVSLLRRVGCAVEAAADGLAGLRAASQGGHDIVFTDIRMPVLDGMQMLQRLREQLGERTPPVVAVSASSLEHERRHYIGLGFSDFVGKPYGFEEIHRMLALHAGAQFVADKATAPPAVPPTAAPAAGPPRLGPLGSALLTALAEAADLGALKPVRHALAQLAAQAESPDPTDTLPADAIANLQAAASDYDFDRLSQYARALLAGREALHPLQPETLPP